MMTYHYTPRGVCSREIHFDIEDGKLHNVAFVGGCDGNLKAIGKLLEGADAANVMRLLRGNQCKDKGTSCADQLAIALEGALAQAPAAS